MRVIGSERWQERLFKRIHSFNFSVRFQLDSRYLSRIISISPKLQQSILNCSYENVLGVGFFVCRICLGWSGKAGVMDVCNIPLRLLLLLITNLWFEMREELTSRP